MKKTLLMSALLTLLAGCSMMDIVNGRNHLYEIRMMNGDSLYASAKPHLDSDNYYRFNDVNNQRYILNKNLVLYIEPASAKR